MSILFIIRNSKNAFQFRIFPIIDSNPHKVCRKAVITKFLILGVDDITKHAEQRVLICSCHCIAWKRMQDGQQAYKQNSHV